MPTRVPGPGGRVPGPKGVRARRPSLGWFLSAAVLVVGSLSAGVFSALTADIGYYEFHPGSAQPVADLISVAPGVATFPPTGDIAFTTVTLRHSTAVSYVLAWFDDDVELVEQSLINGNRSDEENRQYNLALMDTSKQDAVRSALVELGYDVPITMSGSQIIEIEPGSAADGVFEPGETLTAIDGEVLDEISDIARIMTGKAPGDTVHLDVESVDRSSSRMVDLVLGASPDDPTRGLIGVRLQARDPSYAFPFAVDIESGRVGGPSAGLAFSLAVLDLLTPGELTGKHRVAVTGTIDSEGNVGPVGGVRQKTAAVIEAGFDVFLVPGHEYDDAVERAGSALEVIQVDTLREALDALASLGGSGLGSPPGQTEPEP